MTLERRLSSEYRHISQERKNTSKRCGFQGNYAIVLKKRKLSQRLQNVEIAFLSFQYSNQVNPHTV